MKKTCECCQCGKIFGTDNLEACKFGFWIFCCTDCLQQWAVESSESLDDEYFKENEDDGE